MKNAQAKTDFPVNIGNPARSALHVAGFSKLKQLTKLTEAELSKLHGMGPKMAGFIGIAVIGQHIWRRGVSRIAYPTYR